MRQRRKHTSRGFTLMELLIATVVLITGILAGVVMIIVGMSRDNANRLDTTSTNAAQTVLEQIASASANNNAAVSITDCHNNVLTINTAAGGAPLTSSGDIDFTQAAVNGYQMNYTFCGSNGLTTVYDIRWNVSAIQGGTLGKLVTVSASQPFMATQKGFLGITPVTLRTIVGI
jgi:type II secretory pathway pseudopilin PulG